MSSKRSGCSQWINVKDLGEYFKQEGDSLFESYFLLLVSNDETGKNPPEKSNE